MLQSKNVRLRALEPSDVDLLYEWENNTEVWIISNTLKPFSKYTLTKFIEADSHDIYELKQLRFMIDSIEMNETVGMIDIYEFDPYHRRAGIGIFIDKRFRQKNFASEALDLLIDYGFNFLNLNQFFCEISVSNETSINLFKKKGFTITGLKKQWLFTGKNFEDVYFLQLIKREQ